MYVCMYVCMYVVCLHVNAWNSKRPEQGVRSPQMGVTESCELLWECPQTHRILSVELDEFWQIFMTKSPHKLR